RNGTILPETPLLNTLNGPNLFDDGQSGLRKFARLKKGLWMMKHGLLSAILFRCVSLNCRPPLNAKSIRTMN
ncbi:MAG: hypothetical protein AAGJ51_00945, partial [Pseudomonadota bacterium]